MVRQLELIHEAAAIVVKLGKDLGVCVCMVCVGACVELGMYIKKII